MDRILDTIKTPEQIAELGPGELKQLADEVRELIIQTVSQNGGHLGSSLGVVELTIALLIVFQFRRDKIVFDVGHQSYAWKILTGRSEQFRTLRKLGGLAGFPKRSESPYDFFNTGHSSTSISAALGLRRAMSRLGKAGHVIALIGDGALTGGMAFEALNDAGQSGEDLLVIVNDNQMSIGRNVGGLSRHLENLRISPRYIRIKTRLDALLLKIPLLGRPLYNILKFFKMITRMMVQHTGVFFEQLGFRYYGPVDGHDLPSLVHHLKVIQELKGPVLLHVMTQKGKGYRYAEESPDLYHGVAPFVIENGVGGSHISGAPKPSPTSFSAAFGARLTRLAHRDARICAISAAMTAGTGLADFAEQFPARFFDVGIAEQHAVTLAAGLAAGGMRPVVALYSTFLQRAFDQLLHDICLQNLPVVLAIDRAGIVGEDGETHQGIYDLGLLLPLPGIEIFCPPDYASLADALDYAVAAAGPVAIRYPRGGQPDGGLAINGAPTAAERAAEPDIHQVRLLRPGSQVTLAALGTLAGAALKAAAILAGEGIDTEVLLISCAKPLDTATILASIQKTGHLVVVEETLSCGGIGQSMLPCLIQAVPELRFQLAGLPDAPLCQGSRDQLLEAASLKPDAIAGTVRKMMMK
jgi:1-deoxy-D-xylulose-5-phosphate synthase